MGEGPRKLKWSPRQSGRNRTVPAPRWFIDQLRALRMTEQQLAELTTSRGSQALSKDQIGRVRRGQVVTIEALDSLAFALKWPRPVLITESREEAEKLEEWRSSRPIMPPKNPALDGTTDGEDLSKVGSGADPQQLPARPNNIDRGDGYPARPHGKEDQGPPHQPRKPSRGR